MNYNIKIVLALVCFIGFALNKDMTVPKTNNNQTVTSGWDEEDKKIKNPELKKLLDNLKKDFIAERESLKKEFKKKQNNLKEEFAFKRQELIEEYRNKNKKKIKPIPNSSNDNEEKDINNEKKPIKPIKPIKK